MKWPFIEPWSVSDEINISLFLPLQRMTSGKAVHRWDSVKPAWRVSSRLCSSSSTCCWRRWRCSSPTRLSLTSWTNSTTLLCLSPTKRLTCFHPQVCKNSTYWGVRWWRLSISILYFLPLTFTFIYTFTSLHIYFKTVLVNYFTGFDYTINYNILYIDVFLDF